MDHTYLPVEILAAFFDYLTLEDLLAVFSVCRLWRQLAFDAPAYWSSISLTGIVPEALEVFIRRLQATRGRPFTLQIILPQWSLRNMTPPTLSAELVDIISSFAIHMTALKFHTSDNNKSLNRIISRPAPLLRYLDIQTGRVVSLRDLSTVALRYLRLEHLTLELLQVPTLPTVETLVLIDISIESGGRNYASHRRSKFDTFQRFPNLRHLFAATDTHTIRPLQSDIHGGDDRFVSWTKLEQLCLDGTVAADWEDEPDISVIPHIIICLYALQVVPNFLMHLGSLNPLELSVDGRLRYTWDLRKLDNFGVIGLHFKDMTTQRMRSFYESWTKPIGESMYCFSRFYEKYFRRVLSLAVSTIMWKEVVSGKVLTIQNLQELRIVIDPNYVPMLPLRPFPFYDSLRTVILHTDSPGGVLLDARDIDLLAISAFCYYKGRFPLRLQLENVVLDRSDMHLWHGQTFRVVDEEQSCCSAWR